MQRVFISHPLFSEYTQAKNFLSADRICRKAKESGYLPVSPLHLFSYFEETETESDRLAILEYCKTLIDTCDEVWSYGISGGCVIEVAYAKEIGKPIVDKRGDYLFWIDL